MAVSLRKGTPWRAEVLVFNEHNWASNALRFTSESEALSYGFELRSRWMLVDKVRAVPDTTPEREPYTEGSEAKHYQDLKACPTPGCPGSKTGHSEDCDPELLDAMNNHGSVA